MFRHRIPGVHTAVVWLLIGVAIAGLVAGLSFLSVLNGLRFGAPAARPPRHPSVNSEQAPSLFGKVTAIDGPRVSVDSKQPYAVVLIDADTALTSVGGDTRSLADLKPGMLIAATGRDTGRGELAAVDVVILDHP